MKERLHKDLRTLGLLLLGGLGYYIFVSLVGWGLPCPIKAMTGYDCASCGITRMIVSAVKLDFAAAFRFNPVLFVTLPFVVICLLHERITYIKTGRKEMHPVCKVFLFIEIAILLVYGVVRNIG